MRHVDEEDIRILPAQWGSLDSKPSEKKKKSKLVSHTEKHHKECHVLVSEWGEEI